MSWTAHSETPFANAQKAVIDVSGLSEQFRDGQKLRQEYEARQQQKALNQLMAIPDFNERITQARQHKYAGALVPELQKYEEARQKAALDNLKASADIGKVFAESGKLGAETGKIGAEAQGQTIKNVGDTQNHISALALAKDPKVFAIGIGELNRQGLITPDQAEMMIKMVGADPQSATAVLQSMARTNPEVAKIFAPKVEYSNLGDKVQATSFDPLANSATPLGTYDVGQSPDNAATTAATRYASDNSLAGTKYSSDNSLRGTQYSSDNSYNASVYGTDVRAQTASQDTAVKWFTAENKAKNDAANTEIKAYEAQNKGGGAAARTTDGQPTRKLSSTEQKELIEIKKARAADANTLKVLSQMLGLVQNSYSGVGAGLRSKVMSLGGGTSSANDTVLYNNLATSQALSQLKATFGAAPTEGERKILMDIQASVDKTPQQKIAIINAAVNAVRTREAYRKQLENGINTGRYTLPSNNSSAPKQVSKSQAIGQKVFGGK